MIPVKLPSDYCSLYIYIYIYIYMCVCVCVCMCEKWMKISNCIKKFICYNYFSHKNNFDKIFLYSDKTLKSKRVGAINEPPNISFFRFTSFYIYIYIYIYILFFNHTTCESTCDTLASSAANQGDNTVSVVQGGTATKHIFLPFYLFLYIYIYM